MNINSKRLLIIVNVVMITMTVFAVSVSAQNLVEKPVVTKTTIPTEINTRGSGVNEETTVKITVTGAGEEWATPIPIDVMLIVDRSGSMRRTKLADAKTAAKTFVDLLNSSEDRSGLVSFASRASLDQGLTFNQSDVKSAIDSLSAYGMTAIGDGIHLATTELLNNGRSNATLVEILLSDGFSNQGSNPLTRANEAANESITIYTIGLGAYVDPRMPQIANITGGKYYYTPNSSQLEEVYKEIYRELQHNTIPHYVDVVEVTQRYIVDEGSFNVAPDNVSTDPVTGETTIIWNDVGSIKDDDPDLSPDERVNLTFTVKSGQNGQNLPVDVAEKAKVYYKDSEGGDGGSVDIPQVYINVNCPPVADADGPYSVPEGTLITFNASGSYDLDGDTLQYRWDFDDDGLWDTAWSHNQTASHTWCDDHTGRVKVEVSDGVLTDNDTALVTINNTAPTVDAGYNQTVNENDMVCFSGSFTDPGCDTWTYEWDFGDGSPVETGTCTPGTPITATHIYPHPDIYTATLVVTDDDGGVGSDDVKIRVRPTTGLKYVDVDSEGRIVYMLSRFGEVYYTTRENDNWRRYGTGPWQPPIGEYVGVSSQGINCVYILREDGTVYYTLRSNDNWRQYGTGPQQPSAGNYVDLTSDGIRKVYILRDDGTVYYTLRSNDNWRQYGSGAPPPGRYVGIAGESDEINYYAYILRDDGTVYYTNRTNESWTQYGTVAPPGDYVDIVSDNITRVYILRDDGTVYYTNRTNESWTQYGTGFPQPPGPGVFGYQALSSEWVEQMVERVVYILNEEAEVYYTSKIDEGWCRYGTGPQQPPT
ncbi:von Willebrand factor type A domain protein [Candidatus Methanoperedenaceae archaeon GB50]|nr:von Willebrand factor type A domain protein [Candidatus Methanoperedenaceae archaeon GB50]